MAGYVWAFRPRRFAFVVTAVVLGLLASGRPGHALTIYADQDATWKYINTSSSTMQTVDSNWYAYNYDDSGWYSGVAPFSSGPTSSTFGADLANAGGPYASGVAPAIPSTYTYWAPDADPYLRLEFNLAAKTDLTIWLAIDNGINSIYMNGVEATGTGTINAEGQAFRWENVFDISADYTVVGTNVLALQLEDHGGATAFALVVSGNDSAVNTPLTTNPPPEISVPAPGAVLLLGLGVAGIGGMGRMRRRRA